MSLLTVGETIVHYRIRSLLGEGGMGEVYLAEDERLRRPVALKVLRDASERFLFEARAASALNHPNVGHIYDVGRERDLVFIAMEYVEGVTLETRIASGPLMTSEVVDIAAQLADALCEAYAKGIVHRDLKPGNIVINQRGQAKILDFGIAKMPEGLGGDTTPNSIVGTVPYMSPEQARGRAVDPRSDIFSFGTILYEMVTGVRPFDGTSVLDTMRNIVDAQPAPVAEQVPAALRRIIDTCLEKDRDRRYASPRQLVAELRELQAPAQPERARRIWAVVAIAVAGLVILGQLLLARRERKPVPPPRLVKVTTAPGLEDEPAISPDGKSIAYTSDEHGNLDVFVRPLAGGEAIRLTDSDSDDAQPAWSPDGTRIAFVSGRGRDGRLSIVLGQSLGNFMNANGGDLFVVPAAGGAPVKLLDNAFYPSWSPDGKSIAVQSSRGGRWDIWKIEVAGGVLTQLTRDLDFDYQPSWSPDGKTIVYGSGMPEPYRLKTVAATGGPTRVLTDGKDGVLLKPVFASDGKSVLYSSARGGSLNLWRLSLAAKKAEPERLTLGEGDDVNPSVAGTRVVYASVRQTPDLWTLDVVTSKLEQLTFDTSGEEFPHRSASGVLTFASDRGGSQAIWLRDASGALKVLAARPDAGQPRWSPDGTQIAYRYRDKGQTRIAIQRPGSAELRIMAHESESPAWSPDGKQLAFTSWAKYEKAQIAVVPVNGRGAQRYVTSLPLTTSYPTWSPDGTFIAFQATRDDGTRHVWIVEVATGRARALTRGASEDSHPQWSPRDGDVIFFVRNHENLMSVRVSTGEVAPVTRFAEPNMILDYPGWSIDGSKMDFSIARKRGDLYMLEF